MDEKITLIVNADDFGLSPGVNSGIIRAHEQGIVTSASLMVRGDSAVEAAEYARRTPRLSVGLHFDIGEWMYKDGSWEPLYEVVPAGDEPALAGEIARQLAAFRRLIGRLPTHLDSHQHVHLEEPVRSLLCKRAGNLGIPLRHYSGVRYCGDFYGQTGEGNPLPGAVTASRLIAILGSLGPGTTELCCHPGDGAGLNTMYREERAEEVRALCDASVRATVGRLGIALESFRDLRARSVPENVPTSTGGGRANRSPAVRSTRGLT